MVIDRKNKLLGELLVHDGLISRDQLRIALTDQEKSGEQLGHILVSLGFISESVLRDVLGEALGQESIELTSVVPDASALQLKTPMPLPKGDIKRGEQIIRRSWEATKKFLDKRAEGAPRSSSPPDAPTAKPEDTPRDKPDVHPEDLFE